MSVSTAQFYVSLPDGVATLPRTRRREFASTCDDEQWEATLPYLRGLASLPDFLAHIAGYRTLTPAEEACLDRHLAIICTQVRAARTKWEATQQDAVECR